MTGIPSEPWAPSDGGAGEARRHEVAGSVRGARSEPWAPSDARPGRPDPAPAGERTAAALIDMLPVLVLLVGAAVLRAVTDSPWWAPLVPVVVAVCWTGLLWWGASADGRTVGKRAMGIAVVDGSTATVPGPWPALGRLALRGALSLVTLGVAGLSFRWDPAGRQRTWWDRAFGTAVIPRPVFSISEDETADRWAPSDVPTQDGVVRRGGGGAVAVTGGWVPGPQALVPGDQAALPESTRAAQPAVSGPVGSVPPVVSPPPPPLPPPLPPPVVAPMPSGRTEAAVSGDAAEFLAPQLIGGQFRVVPHESGATPGRPSPQMAPPDGGVPPALITSIDPGTGQAVGKVPIPEGPSPAVPPPPATSSPRAPDPAATVRIPARSASLVWDTGRHVTVAGRVLVGRNPKPSEGEHVDQLLPVTTDSVGVSKTHLLIEVGVDGITVTDRRSTNGVRIVRADGSVRNCPAGEPVVVRPGDAVHFGGRSITVAE